MSKPLQTKILNWEKHIEVVVDVGKPGISEPVVPEEPHILASQPHQDNLLVPLEEPARERTPDIADATAVGLRSKAQLEWRNINQSVMNGTTINLSWMAFLFKDHQTVIAPNMNSWYLYDYYLTYARIYQPTLFTEQT